MALPPRDHRISLAAAAALTKRHREAKVWTEKSGAFHKDQVLKLLGQPGCVALRIHYGRSAVGAPALILTAVDSTDSDITGGTILEEHVPCPPFCGDDNPLNG